MTIEADEGRAAADAGLTRQDCPYTDLKKQSEVTKALRWINAWTRRVIERQHEEIMENEISKLRG